MTKKRRFKSGATRDDDMGDLRFDLIDPYALERLASIYGKGAVRHGDRNWENGMPTHDILNRAMRHLVQYLKGERQEDFPAKIAWAMFAIMRMEATHPEMCTLPKKEPKKDEAAVCSRKRPSSSAH